MNDAKNIAIMCANQTQALLYNLQPDVITYKKIKQHIIENCAFVEWEHNMEGIIPVCKKTGQYCDAQCSFNNSEVIHCKNCKWYDEQISMCNNCGLPREQTFFCADGTVRKVDEKK